MRPPDPHRPSTPAWYRDPDDPTRLRHWSGRGWDHRRRSLPTWAVGTTVLEPAPARRDGDPVLEGPVHPAALPATAAATAAQASRHRPAVVAARPGGGQGRGGSARPSAPGSSPHGRAVRPMPWARPRAVLMTMSTLVGIALLIVAAAVGVGPAPNAPTQLAQDTSFLQAATVACGADIGSARLSPTATISAAGTIDAAGSPTPTQVTSANRRLAALEGRLLALSMTDAARTSVQGWLDGWNHFAADRLALAVAAARHDGSTVSPALVDAPRLDAATADAFALSNHLDACTLSQQGAGGLTRF